MVYFCNIFIIQLFLLIYLNYLKDQFSQREDQNLQLTNYSFLIVLIMHTTYHFLSAQELSTEILDSIKAKFKSKPITIIVKENDDEIELSSEMKSMLNDRLKEDEATYLTLKESMDRLKNKYDL